ncbi:MAG: hypothetical protein ACOYMG_28335 [Candidatus Methylumidiphilus sp.]
MDEKLSTKSIHGKNVYYMRQKRFNGHAIPPFPARPQTYNIVDTMGSVFHSIVAIGTG